LSEVDPPGGAELILETPAQLVSVTGAGGQQAEQRMLERRWVWDALIHYRLSL
jgi:hypothetical protein